MSSASYPPGTAVGPPRASRQVIALLAANGRSLWNAAWNRGPRRRRGLLLGVGLGAMVWLAAIPVIASLLGPSLRASPGLLLTTVTGVLVLLTGFTLVTSLSFAVASAYFARDLEWLLTVPISARSLLAHRLASQLTLGIAVGAAVLGPILLAAGIDSGTIAGLSLVLVALMALLATPVAVGLLLVVLVVRLFPASRVRDGTAGLVCLVGLAMAAVGITRHRSGRGLPWAGAVNPLGSGWWHSAWLPPGWAARLVTLTWRGDWSGALWWLLPLVGLALVALAGALWLGGPLHREGWARAQVAPRRRPRGAVGAGRLPPVLALLRKDGRNLRRDPVQLSQLILPLALFAVYLLAPQGGSGSAVLFRDFPLWYGPLTTSAFAALFVVSGLGLRAVGSEGRNFWCLRAAPLGIGQLLLGKLALPALVAVGAALTLMGATELRAGLTLPEIGFSAVLLTLCVTGLAALATGLGAIWPRLDWTDPRRAAGIWLSVVFLVVGSAYIAVCMVALTIPLVITQLGPLGSQLLAIGACAVCALIGGAISLRLGHARLRRLEV